MNCSVVDQCIYCVGSSIIIMLHAELRSDHASSALAQLHQANRECSGCREYYVPMQTSLIDELPSIQVALG